MQFTDERLFRENDLLILKRGIDGTLNSMSLTSRLTYLDEIELQIIPTINVSIETKQNGLNFLIEMSDTEVAAFRQKAIFLEKLVAERRAYLENPTPFKPTKLNIIEALNFDCNFVLSTIDKQIAVRDFKKYIVSSNRVLFDTSRLTEYLLSITENTPYLENRFKEILTKCQRIIDFDNHEMREIESETHAKDIFNRIDFGDWFFSSMRYNYECKLIEDNHIRDVNLHTQELRNDYYCNYGRLHKTFDSNDFARKCVPIIQIITSHLGINSQDQYAVYLYSSLHSEFIYKNDAKLIEITDAEPTINPVRTENPHPDKFVSLKAFEAFEKLHTIYGDESSKTQLADYSFIYRQMEKDGLLKPKFKPEVFKLWISEEPYKIVLDASLKQINNCGAKKKLSTYRLIVPV